MTLGQMIPCVISTNMSLTKEFVLSHYYKPEKAYLEAIHNGVGERKTTVVTIEEIATFPGCILFRDTNKILYWAFCNSAWQETFGVLTYFARKHKELEIQYIDYNDATRILIRLP
jgi:hypothetical protein